METVSRWGHIGKYYVFPFSLLFDLCMNITRITYLFKHYTIHFKINVTYLKKKSRMIIYLYYIKLRPLTKIDDLYKIKQLFLFESLGCVLQSNVKLDWYNTMRNYIGSFFKVLR